MTIKQFSEKYNLPYQVVYTATWGLNTSGGWRDREYDEEELRNAVLGRAMDSMKKHREGLDKAMRIIGKVSENK